MTAVERTTLDRERRTRIERPWPRWRWGTKGEDRWTGFDERLYAVAIGGACFLVVSSIEIPWLLGYQAATRFGGVGRDLLVILPIALLNAIVLDRMISARTSRQREVAPWLRILRFLVLGIPILGLVGIPQWRTIVIGQPRWAFPPRKSAHGNTLSPTDRFSRLRLRADAALYLAAQRFPALAAWVTICQVLPLLTFINWLASIIPPRPHLALAILASLHVTAAACGWTFAKTEIAMRQVSGLRAVWFRVSPLLFLAPAPVMFVGATPWISLGPKTREESSQAESLYSPHAQQTGSQADLFGDREPGPGRRENAFRRTVLGHSFLGLGVGAWVGFFFGAQGLEFRSSWPGTIVEIGLCGILLAGLLGLARRHKAFVQRLPRLSAFLRPPLLVAASTGPLALVVGFQVGHLFGKGNWRQAIFILAILGIIFAIFAFVAMIGLFSRDLFRTRSEIGPGVIILLMIGGLSLVGPGLLITKKETTEVAISIVRGLAVATLFAHLALGLAALATLLHPFRLAHLSDRSLPRSLRARLGGLTVTALLPLGGLPAPWWIWNRRSNGRADARVWWEKVARAESFETSEAAVR